MNRPAYPSDKVIARVAWLYYAKDMTQREIADTLSLSRPTVISYLKQAKERRIVCVRIAPEHYRLNRLADALVDTFGLASAHVLPDEGLDGEALTHAVCEAAAQLLPGFVGEGDVLGVSWGQTVSFVSELVPAWPIPNLTVLQLLGSIANPLLSTSENCSTEIARRLGAHCVNFNAPAVCSSAALASALKEEPIIREQLDNLTRCNKAIYSLSPCTPDTHVVQFKIATVEDIDAYRKKGAIGIIAGRFIDAEGRAVTGELDDRLIGVGHDLLRAMEGMLVVSGAFKREAALAALRGGFANHIVTDARLAKALIGDPGAPDEAR